MSKKMKEMLEAPLPVRCGLYTPGHEVHWIPGIRFVGEPRFRATVEFHEGEQLVLFWQGPALTYYNHDLGRIQKIVEIYGQANISFNLQRSLLYVDHGEGSNVFYLSSVPLEKCTQ